MITEDIFWRLPESPHTTWLESRVGGCLLLVRRSDENKWYWSVTRLSDSGDLIGQDIAIHSPEAYEHVEIAMHSCQQAFLANFAGHRILS